MSLRMELQGRTTGNSIPPKFERGIVDKLWVRCTVVTDFRIIFLVEANSSESQNLLSWLWTQ